MSRPAPMPRDLLVVGAGAVGLATALWAQKMGLDTVLADPSGPGSGASFGNAGVLATYAAMPVMSPALWRALPRLALRADSPVRVDLRHALRRPRWLLTFLRNCAPARVRHISGALARLLEQADDGLDPLIVQAGAQDLVRAAGALTLFADARAFAAARDEIRRRSELGIAQEVLERSAVHDLEPGIGFEAHRGVFYPDARHVHDPGALMTRFHQAFLDAGGESRSACVRAVLPESGHVRVMLDHGAEIHAAHVVLAAGAHSTRIAGSGAEALPLDTERGYHVMFPKDSARLLRPVGWPAAGIYATPMADGLRCAGTVELAGLDRPPTPGRWDVIERRARQMVSGLGPGGERWMGFRPSMPDALPVLGASPRDSRITFAFGHQHVGLTLSGVTGRIAAGIAAGRRTNLDLEDYAASRFSR